MFRIRRIHDDVLDANRVAIAQVQAMLRAQFPGVRAQQIDEIPEQLRDPMAHQFRTVLFVAERQRQLDVRGFALVAHAPDLEFCYLDFISAAPKETGRGVGGALYDRVREECRALGSKGLFFECLPDDPEDVSDPAVLEQNRARLRFYERHGARPIVGTGYRTALTPGGSSKDLPHLVYDDLGCGTALSRDEARAIVRAILERKYAWLVSPAYVETVVGSIVDDPVRIREPRYVRKAKPKAANGAVPPAPPAAHERIALFVSRSHELHHVRERGYVEAPVRIAAIRREIERLPFFEERSVASFDVDHVRAVHDPEFVDYLERMCAQIKEKRTVYPYVFPIRNPSRMPDDLETRAGYYCIDTFTPLHHDAWIAAKDAADCALGAASALLDGARLSYALVRPPGHHAERRTFGGFCYLNSAAIAAHYLSAKGKVAMLDLDYHHGNGQQDVFYERDDVLTVSIHGHPRFAYPYFAGFEDEIGEGRGRGFNMNLPLPEQVDGAAYDVALARALDAVRAFEPRHVVVCLGLDPGRGDPTGTWSLVSADFERNGRAIGALGLPTMIAQEGGYLTRNLGVHARHFFRGLWESTFGRPSA